MEIVRGRDKLSNTGLASHTGKLGTNETAFDYLLLKIYYGQVLKSCSKRGHIVRVKRKMQNSRIGSQRRDCIFLRSIISDTSKHEEVFVFRFVNLFLLFHLVQATILAMRLLVDEHLRQNHNLIWHMHLNKKETDTEGEVAADVPSTPVSTKTVTTTPVEEKPLPAAPIAEPVKPREPIPENQQRELFKWLLEEKRKVKPKDPEEKKRIDEEKAILKQFIRAKSIPSSMLFGFVKLFSMPYLVGDKSVRLYQNEFYCVFMNDMNICVIIGFPYPPICRFHGPLPKLVDLTLWNVQWDLMDRMSIQKTIAQHAHNFQNGVDTLKYTMPIMCESPPHANSQHEANLENETQNT
ncbi:hypothetical protein RJ641_023992 [Dillenia turbinata]|uniref:Uncharacterized protein n=1 Tax=Dillenia turbinata TaxID=194707 RepID=A0AAN8UFM0_9MAGN